MPRKKSDLITYELDTKKKTGEIQAVIAKLQKQEASAFTKIASKYLRTVRLIKTLDTKKKELNKNIKELAEGLFDAEDMIYKRLIRTLSLTVTLSAAGEKEVEEFDEEGYINELEEIVEGLGNSLEDLKAKYTTLTTTKVPTRLMEPKANIDQLKQEILDLEIGIKNENIIDIVARWWVAFRQVVDSFVKNLRKKLQKIDMQLDMLEHNLGK